MHKDIEEFILLFCVLLLIIRLVSMQQNLLIHVLEMDFICLHLSTRISVTTGNVGSICRSLVITALSYQH